MQPEELLEEFLTLTNIKVGNVCVDNEFPALSTFEVFCKKCHIVLCLSAAYTHTMQARAEGAVRICKEHVCCLLKASNAPACFWSFALLHWCRIYNYWPGSKTLPPWDTMEKSKLCFDMEQDLHQWACYMQRSFLWNILSSRIQPTRTEPSKASSWAGMTQHRHHCKVPRTF
eukprot:3733019-Rhodomonas_salina.1